MSDSILKKRDVYYQPHSTKVESEAQSVSNLAEVTGSYSLLSANNSKNNKFLIKASYKTLNPHLVSEMQELLENEQFLKTRTPCPHII